MYVTKWELLGMGIGTAIWTQTPLNSSAYDGNLMSLISIPIFWLIGGVIVLIIRKARVIVLT